MVDHGCKTIKRSVFNEIRKCSKAVGESMRRKFLGLGLGDLRPLMMTIPQPSQHYPVCDLCCSPYRLNTLPNLQEYLEFLQSVTKMTKPLCGLWTPCVVLCTPRTKLASPTPGGAAMHTKQFSPHHSPRMAHR